MVQLFSSAVTFKSVLSQLAATLTKVKDGIEFESDVCYLVDSLGWLRLFLKVNHGG